MCSRKFRFHSLEDYLTSTEMTIDACVCDGFGATFPVKGREIQATILFCDISSFSSLSADLSPAETLILVNNFFSWISKNALGPSLGVIDKYIGDEIMIVFSREFGSDDPFGEAVTVARWMCEGDVHAFAPHIGIASGPVIVGYIGTPLKYNCSVLGAAVTLASRCAGIKSKQPSRCSITFPAAEWGRESRKLQDIPSPISQPASGGNGQEWPTTWKLHGPRHVELKNLPRTELYQLQKASIWIPSQSITDKARKILKIISKGGRYWPINDREGT